MEHGKDETLEDAKFVRSTFAIIEGVRPRSIAAELAMCAILDFER
jgi:hypothetical protein